jgi:hypothetical protein
MSTVAANAQPASEAELPHIDAVVTRNTTKLGERWERLRHSDTLRILLQESVLWTAPWTGLYSPRTITRRRAE